MSYDVNQTDNLGQLSDPTYLYSVEKVRAAVSCVYSIMICPHQKVNIVVRLSYIHLYYSPGHVVQCINSQILFMRTIPASVILRWTSEGIFLICRPIC